MRINGHEIVSGKKVLTHSEQLPAIRQTSGVKNTSDSLSIRLNRIFMDKGLDIPPSQIHALESEFLSLGIPASEINSNNALRALLLLRHSIPFTMELLNNTWGNESAIFKNVALLKEYALSLLGEEHFVGENRETVETFVRDINALFKGEMSPESMKYVMKDIIDLWEYDLESKLLFLVEGQSESISDISGGKYSEVELTLKSLLNPRSEDFGNHEAGTLIKALREAVSEIRSRILEIDFRQPDAAGLIKEAVDTFSVRLSVIAGGYESLLTLIADNQLSSAFIAELFGENVLLLEKRLLAQLLINASEYDFAENTEGAFNTLSFKNIIQKSGMSFEWQLLAWYRSGRDPWRFISLLHEDLKGMLVNLSNRLNKKMARGRIKRKLELLDKQSKTIFKNITNRQLSNVIKEYDERKGYYLELPLSAEPNRGHAKITARGSKEPEKNTLNPQNFTLSFEVETSKIGTVNVFMTVSGKTVSLHFELENKRVSALGMDMREEIRDALVARGYGVAGIEFSEHDINHKSLDYKKKTKVNGWSAKNLDIVG